MALIRERHRSPHPGPNSKVLRWAPRRPIHPSMNESSLTAPRPEAPAPEAGPRYNFAAAEPKWQQAWAERGCFRVEDVPKDGKAKYDRPVVHPVGPMLGQAGFLHKAGFTLVTLKSWP